MTLPRLHPAVRHALPADVPRIHELVLALATYERSAHEVRMTQAQLCDALFGDSPAAYALVAEIDGTTGDVAGPEIAGFALYFLNFSTWEGTHGIYVEDLFVDPTRRGAGLGRALLASLAAIAQHRGYARVEWWVLDWNEPSIEFYRRLGAVAMDEWTVFRLTGPALARTAALAADDSSSGRVHPSEFTPRIG